MPGLWGAILSSAIGSILGAPRTLQALSMDRLVPAKLGEVDSETGEPMLALRISGAVALAGALRASPLAELGLNGNAIGDAGAFALAGALASSRLVRLVLANNAVGAAGKQALRDAARGLAAAGVPV